MYEKLLVLIFHKKASHYQTKNKLLKKTSLNESFFNGLDY